MQGRGAGSYPTGAAVLSDVSALSHGYKYEFKKHVQKHATDFTNDVFLNIYFRYNSADDLSKIKFTEIKEQYTGEGYHYVVGKINLKNIIENKTYILQHKLFLALVDDVVS